MGMSDQPGHPLGLVVADPCIHGIGIAWLEEPGPGHAMGGLTVGDLQDGGGPLADIGARVMVAHLK
jgi:hypothetical protein